MSQFSRRARWLNSLFPASVLPQSQDPGEISDDVSLVQNYDGGGWGFPAPDDFIVNSPILDGVTGVHIYFTLPVDEYARLVAMSLGFIGGAGATVVYPNIIDDEGTGNQVFCATPLQVNQGFLGPGGFESFRNLATHVPPGGQMRVEWINGAVGTTFTVQLYTCRAPLGTVFAS